MIGALLSKPATGGLSLQPRRSFRPRADASAGRHRPGLKQSTGRWITARTHAMVFSPSSQGMDGAGRDGHQHPRRFRQLFQGFLKGNHASNARSLDGSCGSTWEHPFVCWLASKGHKHKANQFRNSPVLTQNVSLDLACHLTRSWTKK